MKKFSAFEYKRPDVETTKREFSILLKEFVQANTAQKQSVVMEKINELRNGIDSMSALCRIRHTVNTTDEFYDKENQFFDQSEPLFLELVFEYYKVLVASKFRKELQEKNGIQLFNIADSTIKSFSPEIIGEMQQENTLRSEYSKLVASAKILFEGEERNLSQLKAFFQSKQRAVRKSAYEAHSKFFSDNRAQFESIFDQLVKVRTQMAKKLGYENFTKLGYMRLNRSDYDAKMVANFRKQVEKEIVPLTISLVERQRKRLGLQSMKYYDEALQYLSGNAKPKGTPEWIIENGKKMYKELSSETDVFFTFMTDYELFDLLAKKGKASGGYCSFVGEYKAPFIFSNFNGTSADIDVLTHEAGHAFQMYCSANYEILEYRFPTYEACEIHSMSMEFFAYPWMNLFFGEDEAKYKFIHFTDALEFLPYGVAVDEFQHYVYANPDATSEERNTQWRAIEKKYLPFRDYEENRFLESGGFWYRQAHIFDVPFYYIDYTLASVCAYQFWVKMNENRGKAWEDYLRLCKAGGSKSFLGLVELANLKSPFEKGTVQSIIPQISKWLNEVDDSKF